MGFCCFWHTEEMCSLLGELLKLGAVSMRPPGPPSEADKEALQSSFVEVLVRCCDLKQLRRTGVLTPKRGFLRVNNMHVLVAPLLIRMRWSRSKVGL